MTGYVGVICKELSPLKVLEHVAPEAQNICQRCRAQHRDPRGLKIACRTYGISPKYVVEGDTSILCRCDRPAPRPWLKSRQLHPDAPRVHHL